MYEAIHIDQPDTDGILEPLLKLNDLGKCARHLSPPFWKVRDLSAVRLRSLPTISFFLEGRMTVKKDSCRMEQWELVDECERLRRALWATRYTVVVLFCATIFASVLAFIRA